MKYFMTIGSIIFSFIFNLNAQINSGANIHRTWVYLNKTPTSIQGILYKVNDTSIIVTNAVVPRDENESMHSNKVELRIDDIDKIYIRKKNKKGKGALLGAFAGFAVGFVIGYAQGDDPPCSSNSWNIYDLFCSPVSARAKGFLVGVPMTFVGAGIGLAIGSIKIKIPINGDLKTYKKNKKNLRNFSIY